MRKTTIIFMLAMLTHSAAVSGKPDPAAVLHGCGGRAVEFSRDGGKLMTAGKEAARVWDGHTVQPVTGPLKHGGELLFACLSADGKRVLTAGSDRTTRVWDADTGKLLASINTGDEIHSAAISPDGAKVVTGGSADLATLWDAATGRKLFELHAPTPRFSGQKTPCPVAFLLFSPDGRRILGMREVRGIYVWDAAGGREITVRPFDNGGGKNLDGERLAHPAAFSPDGKWAISTANELVVPWDVETGNAVCVSVDTRTEGDAPFIGMVSAVALGPNRHSFAAAGISVGVWEVKEGKPELATANCPHVGLPCDLLFSSNGKRYLVASRGGSAGVYDVKSGDQILCIGRKTDELPVVAYSPDGRHVAAAFRLDDYTTIWEVPDAK